jgi:glycosyltransferase involved in cell wall biosynthesis
MHRNPSILTNLAFHQSRTWREAVTTICREGESPDDLGAFRQALRLLRLRSRFDVVVTMAPRPSLVYGLICGILHLPSKQVMAEVFLDAPRPTSLLWRAKTALFGWISRRALGILTNSSAEVQFMARRFRLPESQLRFVPLYTTIESPAFAPNNDGYVYSIGRTLRDLDTLLKAAALFRAPLVLVAGKEDLIPHPVPTGTQVLRELPLENGYEKMRRAAVVVVPLLPAERSTGQVVLFEAMAMGKPVVVTRVTGTEDYIRHGVNGLLIEPGDAHALADAVNQVLRDPQLATRLGQAALSDCLGVLSTEAFVDRLLEAIRDLAAAQT